MAQYLSQTRLEEPIWLEPGDVTFLRTRISETETQVEGLESQMSELKRAYDAQASELRRAYDAQLHALRSSFEAQISELTRQKDTKLVEIASYRNIYSSVRRVPQEILSKNLELYCLPRDGIWDSRQNIIWQTSTLSRVCRVDRSYYSSTLVHAVLVLVKASQCLRKGRCVGKQWVDRCQGLPLDLYLKFPIDDKLCSGATQLFESILRFRNKIRLLDVCGGLSFYLPLFHLRDSSLSLLEEVRFSLYESLQDEYTFADLLLHFPHGIDTLLGAPKLRCVRIEESNEVSILRALVLPAEQLTSLDIDSASHDIERYVYLDMLPRRCGNLVNLKVLYDSEIGPVTFPSSDGAIFLSALHSLHIFCHEVPRKNLLCCLLSPCKAH